jgi:hypothetical protein
VRIGQRNDLPAIARVAQDFLVPGQRRVENDLAAGRPGSTNTDALKDGAVSQCEQRWRAGIVEQAGQ